MIRDFHGVVGKGNLLQEIKAIKDLVPTETWEAIDAVRQVGNIGAHMEKDINIIIDVEENEAKLLINLIEQLFDEWYVARHKRQEKLQAIKNIALDKKNAQMPAQNQIKQP